MKKRFADLSLGDKLFKIDRQGRFVEKNEDHYSYPQSVIEEIPIFFLQLEKDCLLINKRSGYSSTTYDLKVMLESKNESVLKSDDNRYWYFVNEEDKDDVLREMVLNKIKEHENAIVVSKNSNLSAIEKLRIVYWDLLNG